MITRRQFVETSAVAAASIATSSITPFFIETDAALAASRYTDVPDSHWLITEGILDWVVNHRLMMGGEDTFRPGDGTTRAEAATILFRIAYPASVDTGEASLQAVIGEDDRRAVENTKAAPYAQIAFLRTYGIGRGTAAAISETAVLTAAHAVFDSSRKFASSAEIAFAKRGANEPYGKIRARYYFIDKRWYENPDDRTASDAYSAIDFALVVFPRSPSNSTGYFGFASRSNSNLLNQSITISGYPGEVNGVETTLQWEASGSVLETESESIAHNVDTSGGDSGAPVYISMGNREYPWYIVAVHNRVGESSQTNAAARLTSSRTQTMRMTRVSGEIR